MASLGKEAQEVHLHAWSDFGDPAACWPKKLERATLWGDGGIVSFPLLHPVSLADLDGDGLLDLLSPLGKDEAHGISLGVPYRPTAAHWPMYRQGPRRTGRLPRILPLAIRFPRDLTAPPGLLQQ